MVRTFKATSTALFCLALAGIFSASQVNAQGLMEGLGSQASAVGLGAGLAASMNHGKLTHSIEDASKYAANRTADAAKFAAAQTKVIQQYMKAGVEYETKKQWANAEASYKYVLQAVAHRDGPGSANSVPALKHLVAVSQAQNHMGDAIEFQQTIVRFTQNAKVPNIPALLNANVDLTNLFILKGDYAAAQPVIQQSVQIADSQPSVTVEQRRVVKKCYAKLLRKQHKDNEAEAVEAEIEKELAESAPEPTKHDSSGAVADGADANNGTPQDKSAQQTDPVSQSAAVPSNASEKNDTESKGSADTSPSKTMAPPQDAVSPQTLSSQTPAEKNSVAPVEPR